MSSPYIGEIKMFAGTFAPAGWEFCSGQTLAISQYDILYALIGTTYGGDGVNTFRLPDLRGRLPIGRSNQRQLGQPGGSETVTLTAQQLPLHTHGVVGGSGAATSTSPDGRRFAASGSTPYAGPGGSRTAMSTTAVTPTGGGQPHENRPPYMAINFIIATEGIYPGQA